jgi:hypothetical protein
MNSISESIPLKALTDDSDYVNNTETIRKLKHSILIRDEVRKLDSFKKRNAYLFEVNPQLFIESAQAECTFLYNNYMDLFHKMIKDELDMKIMHKLLVVLKLIEDGAVDQYDGSVMVGKVLKELYIDSAMKRGENLDKEYEQDRPKLKEGQAISWKQYKNMTA